MKIAFELIMRAAFVYGAAYLVASLLDERLGLLEVHWLVWVSVATVIFVVMLTGYLARIRGQHREV